MPGSFETEHEATPGGATKSSIGDSGAGRLRGPEAGTISASLDGEGETSTLTSGTDSPKPGDTLLIKLADERLLGSLSTEQQAPALPALMFVLLVSLSLWGFVAHCFTDLTKQSHSAIPHPSRIRVYKNFRRDLLGQGHCKDA